MLLDGKVFQARPVGDFVDWGTGRQWDGYKREFATLFVDLDGTIVRNSAYFFDPYWGDSDGITATIEALNKLYDSGKVQVIVTTSRRPDSRETTEKQLARVGLRYHQIIYGLLHSQRILVNDYAVTNPYKSAEAINIRRDSAELGELLKHFFAEPQPEP